MGCGSFTELNPAVAAPNKAVTARAVTWAMAQMRRENASVRGSARQLRVAWRTVWSQVEAELERREQDPSGSTASRCSAWTSTCGITCPRSPPARAGGARKS